MTPTDREAESAGGPSGVFATTHWSVVLAAGHGDSPQGAAALERLCQTYWLPLYCYIRRRGHNPEDAQDLTQEFFAGLLARGGLAHVSPTKGKFRSFLLASVNHLLSDERDRANRQKRGGGQPTISFDAQTAEQHYRLEPTDEMTPESIFERRWARALVEEVLHRLEQEYAEAGKGELFNVLRGSLTGGKADWEYPAAALRLNLSEGAVRVAVHRMRQHFGDLFRQAVAETVSGPEEIEAEMRHLLAVLGG